MAQGPTAGRPELTSNVSCNTRGSVCSPYWGGGWEGGILRGCCCDLSAVVVLYVVDRTRHVTETSTRGGVEVRYHIGTG